MDTPQWTLGDRITKARKHAGLEQADLAETVGVSRALVSKWERDQSEPKTTQIGRIAEIAKVDVRWLVGSDQPGRTSGWISPLTTAA